MNPLTKQSILIHESGNRLTVRYSVLSEDAVIDDLNRLIGSNENWSPSDFDNTEAYYINERMMLVNMRRIVGFGC